MRQKCAFSPDVHGPIHPRNEKTNVYLPQLENFKTQESNTALLGYEVVEFFLCVKYPKYTIRISNAL